MINNKYRQINGFTLLEVIVAIAIFTIVATLSYGGLNNVLLGSEHTKQEALKLKKLQMALSFIQQDFNQLTNRTIRSQYNDGHALKAGSNFNTVIELTRSGWKNPAERTRSTLQRVAYSLDDNTLYRQYWLHLDNAGQDEPLKAQVLDNVESIEFRFIDASNETHEDWPPLGTTTGTTLSSTLPIAVEVILEIKNMGKINRLFSIVSQ